MSGVGKFLSNIGGPGVKGLLNPQSPQITPPVIPPPPPAPTDLAGNQAAMDAAKIQRAKAARSQDRRSTLLTGPSGVTTPPPVERKSLLGQ
jgi:hypothetical protein